MWIDGRGGARDGAGRPKSDEPKKAFRITDAERDMIKSIRLLDEDGNRFLFSKLKDLLSRHKKRNFY